MVLDHGGLLAALVCGAMLLVTGVSLGMLWDAGWLVGVCTPGLIVVELVCAHTLREYRRHG